MQIHHKQYLQGFMQYVRPTVNFIVIIDSGQAIIFMRLICPTTSIDSRMSSGVINICLAGAMIATL